MILADIVNCLAYIFSEDGPYFGWEHSTKEVEFVIGYVRWEPGETFTCMGPHDVHVVVPE